MAQKMAPTKVGSKKTVKKPSGRKDVHLTSGGNAAAKAKPKTAAAKAQAKHPSKPAPAKAHAPKPQAHAKPIAHAKASAAHAATTHKAPAKAAPKPHAAPRHEAVKPVAHAPSKAPLHKPVMPPPAPRPAPVSAARSMPAAVAKAAGQKIIAPAAQPAPVQPAVAVPPPAAATAKVAVPAAAAKKPISQRHGFKINEWIVYPAHGVGRIVAIEEQEIAGIALELFVITFEKDKMTLRVPTGKSESVGMRKLAEEPTVKKAMETLKGRARVKRTMWSRRAQEYEAKINSGDLVAIAEVVRDLYRSESQPEQSYSERQLYEAALDRMAREIAVVEKLDERGAVQRITDVLAKSARGRRMATEEAEEKAA
jgi:CarD family transcriptional regulator